MGVILKIGRPSKYDGPVTAATSWAQVLVGLGTNAIDENSPAALVLKAGGADTSLAALEHDTARCELFVTHFHAESGNSMLNNFLEALLVQDPAAARARGAIKNLRISGAQAFLETQSPHDAIAPACVVLQG